MRRWWEGWAVEVWWSVEKFGCAIRSSFRWFLMVAPNRAEKRSSCLYARPSHQSTLHRSINNDPLCCVVDYALKEHTVPSVRSPIPTLLPTPPHPHSPPHPTHHLCSLLTKHRQCWPGGVIRVSEPVSLPNNLRLAVGVWWVEGKW